MKLKFMLTGEITGEQNFK